MNLRLVCQLGHSKKLSRNSSFLLETMKKEEQEEILLVYIKWFAPLHDLLQKSNGRVKNENFN